MKSNTVAPNRLTSGQKPDTEKRCPIAAVVPSTSAGATVSTVASRWKSGKGQYSTSSARKPRCSIINSAWRTV